MSELILPIIIGIVFILIAILNRKGNISYIHKKYTMESSEYDNMKYNQINRILHV